MMISMRDRKLNLTLSRAAFVALCLGVAHAAISLPAAQARPLRAASTAAAQQETFATPEAASEALVDAVERLDVEALTRLLGAEGVDLVITVDEVANKTQAALFAEQAHLRTGVEIDPDDSGVAIMSIGPDRWPLPIPIVEESGRWRFDAEAGREEILNRRIGGNELVAIDVCVGFVDAQHEYAFEKRPGAQVNQYARRIVSTPGTRDGLAWQDADGEWRGPVGKEIAQAIEDGYQGQSPFHGYLFRVLRGQGPDAPMGELDFVVNGAMIGGFALVAAPADYGITGVMTFMVSHDGVVYEKDLGAATLEQFRAMEQFNPDSSWRPVTTE